MFSEIRPFYQGRIFLNCAFVKNLKYDKKALLNINSRALELDYMTFISL